MPTIYLIRHGTRVSRNEDTILSPFGVRQAELTGQYFQQKNIKALYASPLPRTVQTAKILSKYIGNSAQIDDRLKERMIYDPNYGITFEAFLDEWDKTMADRNYLPIYGDDAFSAGERVSALIKEIAEDSVIVSHGGAIGDFLRNVFGDEKLQFVHDPKKNLQWVQISECSITEIYKEGTTFSLKRVNDTKHLKALDNR